MARFFFLGLNRIKRSQVIFMGKFGLTALIFGYVFLLVNYSWDTLYGKYLVLRALDTLWY